MMLPTFKVSGRTWQGGTWVELGEVEAQGAEAGARQLKARPGDAITVTIDDEVSFFYWVTAGDGPFLTPIG